MVGKTNTMKKNFGLWPKFSIMLLLVGLVLHKFQVADDDLKAFKEDRAKIEAPVKLTQEHVGELLVQPPIDSNKSTSGLSTTEIKIGPSNDQIPIAYSQSTETTIDVGDGEVPKPEESGGVWGFLKKYWALLLPAVLTLIEVIVRATPTEKDNSVFNFLKFILDKIIPNTRAGGGKHE